MPKCARWAHFYTVINTIGNSTHVANWTLSELMLSSSLCVGETEKEKERTNGRILAGKTLPEWIKLKVNVMFQTQFHKTASGLSPNKTDCRTWEGMEIQAKTQQQAISLLMSLHRQLAGHTSTHHTLKGLIRWQQTKDKLLIYPWNPDQEFPRDEKIQNTVGNKLSGVGFSILQTGYEGDKVVCTPVRFKLEVMILLWL